MTENEHWEMRERIQSKAAKAGWFFVPIGLFVWASTGSLLAAAIPWAATAACWRFWLDPGEPSRFQYDDETNEEFLIRKAI